MQISLDKLPENVQRFIDDELAAGKYHTAEELIASVLAGEAEKQTRPATPRKNTRGMFAEQNVPITFEEIEETSKEACQNFPREFPKK